MRRSWTWPCWRPGSFLYSIPLGILWDSVIQNMLSDRRFGLNLTQAATRILSWHVGYHMRRGSAWKVYFGYLPALILDLFKHSLLTKFMFFCLYNQYVLCHFNRETGRCLKILGIHHMVTLCVMKHHSNIHNILMSSAVHISCATNKIMLIVWLI